MSVTPRKMPYVRLGKSGLKVSRIILGCMTYGSPEWSPWILGEEESIAQIKAAYDAGIQTFDTSNNYSNGASEIILGKAIKQHNMPRDEIVVMTKVWGVVARTPGESYYPKPANVDQLGYVNQHGLSRKHIFDSVRHSLERLQLDYIDVLQCHRWDNNTPYEETMQALHDVVKAGYVRYVGMSSCLAWQFHVMQNYALTHNLTPFISMQNQYSLLYREEEREMMPTLKHFGVGSIPWSPLAGGVLARPASARNASTRGKSWNEAEGYLSGGGTDVLNRVEELAAKKGVSMAQLALAWTFRKDPVAAPIVGASSVARLHDLVGALDVELSDEDMRYLEEKYQPKAMAHLE